MFERGVGAARGGQRRVAAGLLARAVQYDPKHEQAWLWLSGVLDDPSEIAFCLRSVLSINPNNDRARQGLAWLEQRALLPAQTPATPAHSPSQEEPAERVDEQTARRDRESWWVGWRRSHHEMSRARLLVWSVPIVLLLLTMALNFSLRQALARSAALTQAAQVQSEAAVDQPTPAPAPILEAALTETEQAQAVAYLSAIYAPRERLRAAVDEYRQATSQPGNSSLVHASAARKFRDQIEVAYATFSEITPPPALEQAHADYLSGLDQERSALDDMLEFYGSFSIQMANRAILRFEDAGKRLDRARAEFAEQAARSNAAVATSAHTAR